MRRILAEAEQVDAKEHPLRQRAGENLPSRRQLRGEWLARQREAYGWMATSEGHDMSGMRDASARPSSGDSNHAKGSACRCPLRNLGLAPTSTAAFRRYCPNRHEGSRLGNSSYSLFSEHVRGWV